MNRIAVTALAACVMFPLSASPVDAQSTLVNGIYLVTVRGSVTGMMGSNIDFLVNLPAVLVVYPSVRPERPAEICLFINDAPLVACTD
jgi:hypothetical protein